LYRELLPEWTISQLLTELHATEKRGYLWTLELIDLWASFHSRIKGVHDLLDVLGKIPDNIHAINRILKKIHPYEIVTNEHFQSECLKDVLKVTNKNNIEIEYLVCATITGLIDFEKAQELAVGKKVFYGPDDAFASLMTDEYAALCRNDVVTGKSNYFFNSYQPRSAISLDRWLHWFVGIKTHASDVSDRLGAVINNALLLKFDRLNFDQTYAVCIAHEVGDLSSIFPFVKIIIDSIIALEQSTSIYLVNAVENTNLTSIIRFFPITKDVIQADVLVSILKAIRARTKPSWKTPL